MAEAVERKRFEAHGLMEQYPPVWHHANKEIVFQIACPAGSRHEGWLEFSRWLAMPLPETVELAAAAERMDDRPGFYDYEPILSNAVEWHVNFADPNLFVAYGSSLFAQDEMQVAEHPVLGALKQALVAEGLHGVTVELGVPTPVLVTGVERRCSVATEPNASEGRPIGLYGNAFSSADADAVIRATRRIDPPTITNLIAMAAPRPSSGPYTEQQISYVLVAAYTAFTAAKLESIRVAEGDAPVIVHTGFWGCGAFGGNRELMTTLQAVAAAMADLDRLVFHTGDPDGTASVAATRRLLSDGALGPSGRVDELIAGLVSLGFGWGVSDGN